MYIICMKCHILLLISKKNMMNIVITNVIYEKYDINVQTNLLI